MPLTLVAPVIEAPDLPEIDELTRRDFLSAALAAALLAACGDDDTAPTPTATAQPTTRLFMDATGASVEVPIRPQRIVQIGNPRRGLGPLLSLQAPVVGASLWGARDESVAAFFDLAAVTDVGTSEPEIDLEAVAALNPDLIVAVYWAGAIELIEPAVFEQLQSMAPTVAIDSSVAIDQYMSEYATLLGADLALLAAQQAELDALVEELTALLGTPEEITVSAISLREDTMSVYGGPGTRPVNDIIDRTGIQWSALAQEAAAAGGGIGGESLERMREAEADLLIHYGELPEQENALFSELEVVKAGQVLMNVDRSLIGFHYLSYIACAEDMLAQLTAMSPLRTDIV